MKHKKVIILSSLALICALGAGIIFSQKTTSTTSKAASSSWNLVWSDEFNGSFLDTSAWTCETGRGDNGWGNAELQYYTNRQENISVSNGTLKITARNENYNGANYTSARIKTQGKKSFTYGKIEARIKMPSKMGIWPAFWMLGDNITSVGWPKCGELDIMEHVNNENKVYGTVHWDHNGYASYGGNTSSDCTQYHVYSIEWDASMIYWYMDGVQYHAIDIADLSNTDEFHKGFFILLNMAVGGNWPGFNIDNGALPVTMEVDYVRVYQKGSGSSTTTNTTQNTTPKPTTSTSSSSSIPSNGMGMFSSSTNTAKAYVNNSSWVDIHYSVNGAGQLNIRMHQNGTVATYDIPGLKKGDIVKYWFTYSNTSGYTVDTSSYTYTHS